MRPETRYARSGPVSIAYQIVGEGESDLVSLGCRRARRCACCSPPPIRSAPPRLCSGARWLGQGATIEIFSPSLAEDPQARELQARFERQAASPRRVWQLFQMFRDTDVRGVLALIQAQTLVCTAAATAPSTFVRLAG